MVGEENGSIPTASKGPGSVNVTPAQAWKAWGRFGTQAAAARHLLCSQRWVSVLIKKHRVEMGYAHNIAPDGAIAPRMVTPSQKREALEALEEHGTFVAAGRALGVNRRTVKRRAEAQMVCPLAAAAWFAWEKCGSQTKAADYLGISMTTMWRRLQEYRAATGAEGSPVNAKRPAPTVYRSIDEYIDALELRKDCALDAGDDELAEAIISQILQLEAAGF